MNEKYFQITSAVYKAIEFFPEDPLKGKTKEKALEVMEGLVWVFGNPGPIASQKAQLTLQLLENIEVLKTYLRLAKSLGWLDKLNFLILVKEYDRIKEEIKPIAELVEKEKIKHRFPVDNNVDKAKKIKIGKPDVPILSERQNKILEILQSQEKAQVADFKKVFSDISKRTLRRDLDDLLKRGMVIRVGEWNQVVYKIGQSQMS